MTTLTIKHRFTSAAMFTCELPAELAEQPYGLKLGYAIKEAIKAGANLAGANLADADLARADLAGANLARADLAGAYLAGAYLAGANLADADLADADLARARNVSGANLARADLARADLADADLADADLAGANLADADLARADLARAYLAGADLAGANLADADLADADLARARNVSGGTEQKDPPEPYVRATKPEHYAKRAERYRQRNPDVPVIPNLDAQILGVIEAGKGRLDMATWHTCETTHCRAGWAVTLAGDAGKKLEHELGPAVAGRMIYLASTGRVPHFYGTNASAMADIKARAAEQGAAS